MLRRRMSWKLGSAGCSPRVPWLLSNFAFRNVYTQGRYSTTTKKGRIIPGPPAGSCWRVSKAKFEELDRDNRISWGESEDNQPGSKRFLSEVQQDVVPQTYWPGKDVGSTRNAKPSSPRNVFASSPPSSRMSLQRPAATASSSSTRPTFALGARRRGTIPAGQCQPYQAQPQ